VAADNECNQVKKGCHEAVVGTLVEGAFHRGEEVFAVLLPFPAEVLAKFNAGFLLVMWAFRVRLFFAFFIFKADDVVFLLKVDVFNVLNISPVKRQSHEGEL